MNICFICDEYPPALHGGIGTITKSLAEELAKLGNNVFVIGICSYEANLKSYEVTNNVVVHRVFHGLKLSQKLKSILVYRLVNKIFKIEYFGLKDAWNKLNTLIDELIESKSIDIIEMPDYRFAYQHFSETPEYWLNNSVPRIVKFHGSYNYFQLEMNKKFSIKIFDMEKDLYRRANAFISVSEYTRKRMKEIYGNLSPIEVIYNGIEIPKLEKIEWPNISSTEKKVIFAGSLLKKKGVVQLLKAWNLVCNELSDVTLELYGKGLNFQFKSIIDKEHKGRVKFCGNVSKPELLKIYSHSTLAVFPSYSEAFALAPLESMSVGCPTIFTKLSSGPELHIQAKNVLLVDPRNVNELSSAILEVLTDIELRKEMSLQGAKVISEKFNISRIANQHLIYYQKVVDEN